MATVGISQGLTRFGGFGPPNRNPGQTVSPVSDATSTPWWQSGPVWVMVFLIVGYVLVFQTLK